jgi:hypothetical protein
MPRFVACKRSKVCAKRTSEKSFLKMGYLSESTSKGWLSTAFFIMLKACWVRPKYA